MVNYPLYTQGVTVSCFQRGISSHMIFSKRCQLSSLKILLKVQNPWSALGSAAIKSIASYSILGLLWYQMNQNT